MKMKVEKINSKPFEVLGVDYNKEKKKINIDFLAEDGKLWKSTIPCDDERLAIWLDDKLEKKIFISGNYDHNNNQIILKIICEETEYGRSALWRFL